MKILVSGSSGLVGSALVKQLQSDGHEVIKLKRGEQNGSQREIFWDPITGKIDLEQLKGVDAVVNLAGDNIASARWSPSKKKRIWDSRVLGTQNLVRALSSLETPPKVLVNASAIGFYGDTGNHETDESGHFGKGFLASVCKEWEEAADEAASKGMRVVKLRIGVVVSYEGGALKKMLTPFKLGLGGKVGNGRQYMSWIAINDLVGVIKFCIEHDEISGPVNGVSPAAVTNLEFTKTLGKVLGRPTIFPLPGFVAKFVLGEMADELLLVSSRVRPKKLMDAGYQFVYPSLERALNGLDSL